MAIAVGENAGRRRVACPYDHCPARCLLRDSASQMWQCDSFRRAKLLFLLPFFQNCDSGKQRVTVFVAPSCCFCYAFSENCDSVTRFCLDSYLASQTSTRSELSDQPPALASPFVNIVLFWLLARPVHAAFLAVNRIGRESAAARLARPMMEWAAPRLAPHPSVATVCGESEY